MACVGAAAYIEFTSYHENQREATHMATRTYVRRSEYQDGIARARIGVWVHLTRNQVSKIEPLARASGKPLRRYLRYIVEATIAQAVPPEPDQ